MNNSSTLKYTLLLFLFLGICFLGAAIYFFISKRHFIATATKTDGRVINLQVNRKGGKAPVIEFYDASGKNHFYYHNVYSSPSSYDLGETVEIFFDPANPEDATLGGFSVLTIVFAFLGFIFTLIAIIAIRSFRNYPAVIPQKRF